MAVLMTKDKKELIITCKCGCENAYHLVIDPEDEDMYCFLCFLKADFCTEGDKTPWRAFKTRMKKIWTILRGKDYCYSDTVMSKADYEEFKAYVNRF